MGKNYFRYQLGYNCFFESINYNVFVVFFLFFLTTFSWSKNSKPVTAKYSCSVTNAINVIQPLQSGNWNNRAIWPNNTRPSLSDDVLIPEGMTITPFGNCFAKSLTIKGVLSAVKTQENAAWFNLTTEYIMIMGANARFEIGTSAQHYKSNQGANITLIGTDVTKLIPGTTVNSKAIMVMNGGELEMHGKPKISWTQLGATAMAGSNTITLKAPVDWEVGDEIVIASTDFDMNHAEARRITAVNSATSFTLDAPLVYKHFGELQNYTHGKDSSITWEVDERAEVGLLSHNITIKGDDTSEANGYGGHLMCMPGSKMKAENIELYHMGQKATLGRYPWHWHLLQEGGSGLYLKNSSVHRTFNRAVTIHGTNNTLVEGNVAFDNLGHAYFFEDGNEINNVMQYNLGLVTRRPSEADALLPSDVDLSRNMSGPATFWITHPHNKINFNHAAGSDGSGIWFAPHQNRNSELYDPNLNPNHIPVPEGNWDNNVAHSSTHGLLVGPTVANNDATQKVNPNLDYYVAQAPSDEIVEIKSYTLFKNMIGAYLRIGQDSRTSKWENFIIADNYRGEALTWDGDMNKFLWVGASENYEPIPEDAFAVGGSAGLIHLHTIYDGPTRVRNSHFAGVLPGMSLFDQWGANIKYVGHTLTNTSVEDNSFHVNWRKFDNKPVWENATVVDVDGITTGLEPYSVIHKNIPILSNSNTIFLPNSNGAISSPSNKYCYVEVRPSDEVSGSKRQQSTFTRSDGVIQKDFTVEIEGVSLVPMVNNQYTYKLNYINSIPAVNSMYFFSMDEGDNVIIGYPGMPSTAVAHSKDIETGTRTILDKRDNLEVLQNTEGSAYAFKGDVLYVKFAAPIESKFYNLGAIGIIDVCLYGNCEKLDNISYSDSDGDGMFDFEEVSECRDKNSANDLGFEFDRSSEGFIRNDIKGSATSSSLAWQIKTEFQRDPYIQRKGLNIDGNQLKKIKIKLKSGLAGVFKLFWSNEDGSYNTARSLVANYETAGVWQELVYDLEGNENWENKKMSALRLDLPEDPSKQYTVFIDYIRGGQLPQPPQLIPHCSVVGQPLKRTNTVDACAGSAVLFDFLGEFSEDWTFTFFSPNGKIYDGGFNGVKNDQLKLTNLTEDTDLQGSWKVNYFNPDGCGNTDEFIVNVIPSPNLRQFVKSNDSSFAEANSIAVCDGDTVVFDFFGSFSNDWSFVYTNPAGENILGGSNGEDIDQLQITNVVENGSLEGVWQVNYTNPSGCTNNAEFTLNVTSKPELRQFIKVNEESFQETNFVLVEPGDTITFDMFGAFNQDWSFTYIRPDGSEFAGGTNNVDNDQILLNNVTEGSVNEGKWIVNYINPQGCSGSGVFTLAINPTLSLENIQSSTYSNVEMFPNPARNYVYVKRGNFEKNTSIKIYDVVGKLVYTHMVHRSQNQVKIDISSLGNSIYFLKVSDNKFLKKLIVNK